MPAVNIRRVFCTVRGHRLKLNNYRPICRRCGLHVPMYEFRDWLVKRYNLREPNAPVDKKRRGKTLELIEKVIDDIGKPSYTMGNYPSVYWSELPYNVELIQDEIGTWAAREYVRKVMLRGFI